MPFDDSLEFGFLSRLRRTVKKIDLRQMFEILANVGVIAGMIFLALELRQTRTALVAEAFQTRALDSVDNSWRIIGTDDDFIDLALDIESGERDVESLSRAEYVKLYVYFQIRRNDDDNEHFQYEQGLLDPDYYLATTARDIARFAPVWRRFGMGEPRESFRVEVDRILSEQSTLRE